MHAQPSSGDRCLIFARTLHLLIYFMCLNSEGSGEIARMCKLGVAFAGRLCDKNHNLMSWLICCCFIFLAQMLCFDCLYFIDQNIYAIFSWHPASTPDTIFISFLYFPPKKIHLLWVNAILKYRNLPSFSVLTIKLWKTVHKASSNTNILQSFCTFILSFLSTKGCFRWKKTIWVS